KSKYRGRYIVVSILVVMLVFIFFFFSSRRRHTRSYGDWSSDVCSSDLQRSDKALREIENGARVATAGMGDLLLVAGPLEVDDGRVNERFATVRPPVKAASPDEDDPVALGRLRRRPLAPPTYALDGLQREVRGLRERGLRQRWSLFPRTHAHGNRNGATGRVIPHPGFRRTSISSRSSQVCSPSVEY